MTSGLIISWNIKYDTFPEKPPTPHIFLMNTLEGAVFAQGFSRLWAAGQGLFPHTHQFSPNSIYQCEEETLQHPQEGHEPVGQGTGLPRWGLLVEENLNWSHILSIKTNTMQLHVVTYEGNLLSLFLQNCFKVEPKKALHYNGLTFSYFLLFNGIYIV